MQFSPAQRRYNRRIVVTMAGYAVVLLAAIWWFKHTPGAPAPVRFVVALLPALPLCGVFAVLGRYLVEERDEYLRMLMIRQSLIATALTLSAATVWGFLEAFQLVPHLVAYWAATIWFLALGIGASVNALIERRKA